MVTTVVSYPQITPVFVVESHAVGCPEMAFAANLTAAIDNTLDEDANYLRVLACARTTGRKDIMVGIVMCGRTPDFKLHKITVLVNETPLVSFTQQLFVNGKGEVNHG